MSDKKTIKVQIDSEKVDNQEIEPKSEMESGEEQVPNGEEGPLKELEARLVAKEQEAGETYDRLLRVSADFDNYKKRTSREMEEYRKYANQALIKEMLSVVDNLELAMNSSNDHKTIDKDLLKGLDMTHREILKVFEKFHVKPIDSKGQPFDPTFHEAVMQEETDDYEKNTVVNELQKGYMIHDRLLRPAMVVVAKPKEKKDDAKLPESDG